MITRRTSLLSSLCARALLPVSLSALVLLTGCEDEFLTGASITRMRLLGADLSIDGDDERAWLRPGDSATLDMRLAFADAEASDATRDPNDDVRSMILHCASGAVGSGQPTCAETLYLLEEFGRISQGGGGDAGVPGADDPVVQAAIEALAAGVGCDADEPENDPQQLEPLATTALALRNAPVTAQPARLYCPGDLNNGRGDPLRIVFDLADDYATAPAESPYRNADRLVQGVICEFGEPFFKLQAPYFGCRVPEDQDTWPDSWPKREPIAEVFFYTLAVERDGVSNQQPRFANVNPIGIAELNEAMPNRMPSPWSDDAIPDSCDEVTDVNHIADFGDISVITIGAAANRDVTSAAGVMPERRETHQIETFSTYGELERQYSVVDDLDELVPDGDGATKALLQIEWEHGELPVPYVNKLVRFYFVIRDQRGGFALQTRWMCLCRGGRAC